VVNDFNARATVGKVVGVSAAPSSRATADSISGTDRELSPGRAAPRGSTNLQRPRMTTSPLTSANAVGPTARQPNLTTQARRFIGIVFLTKAHRPANGLRASWA
jgi:hypothetical protein